MRELTAIERTVSIIAQLSAFALLGMVGIFAGYVLAGISISYGFPEHSHIRFSHLMAIQYSSSLERS